MNVSTETKPIQRFFKFDALLVVVGIASGLVGNYESPDGPVSKIIPATYAFAIWAPIYASGLYFALWLLRKPVAEYGLGIHLLAVSYFVSGLWVRVQSNNALLLAVVSINLIIVLLQGHLVSKLQFFGRSTFFAVGFSSGTLAGWLTLATAVTFSDGLDISYKATETVAIFTAFAVGFAISSATWIVPTLTYRLTLIWGLLGIIVAQYSQANQVALVAAVGIALLLGLIVKSRISGRALS